MSVQDRLRTEAQRFRALAEGGCDEQTRAYLLGLAEDYETEAQRIDDGLPPRPIPVPGPE